MSAENPLISSRIWAVGALCRAVADALDARFNPVEVRGEISGFSRAGSGHCYFSIKDATGQIRCAMFKRAASMLDFSPKDGELVELRGRLGVYEARGDLQLVVESMRRAGQGALFEQFLRLKAQLEGEGLFDPAHKRSLPLMPRAIGVVTSLGAAAWHDVVTALQRRVPHIPVRLAPAAVQGAGAASALVQALQQLYAQTALHNPQATQPVDVILLVRGGGSMEDLWSFNDEQLARTMAASPVPIICGVGHETDFTIADFVADVRAPTPTAAAEMACQPLQVWRDALDLLRDRLDSAVHRHLDRQAQRVDTLASRLGRPSTRMAGHRLVLERLAQQLEFGRTHAVREHRQTLLRLAERLPQAAQRELQQRLERLARAKLRLELLDPRLVLERGYAWLTGEDGQAITTVQHLHPGQVLVATLADGDATVTVSGQPRRH
jgi:exodeoxyribonuclease VII large subunit